MTEELVVTSVHSSTSGQPGRSLNQARSHHLVIDEPARSGGPGEEITPGESFLAGISACGVLMVERQALQTGIALRRAEARIDGLREARDTSWFTRIDLRFQLLGPRQEEAEALVAYYQGH